MACVPKAFVDSAMRYPLVKLDYISLYRDSTLFQAMPQP
jgi:hypothetical protein